MSTRPASPSTTHARGLGLRCVLCALLAACDAGQFSQDSDTVAVSRPVPSSDRSPGSGGSAGDGAGSADDVAAVSGSGAAGSADMQANSAGATGLGAAGESAAATVTPPNGSTNVAANGGGKAGAPAVMPGKPVIFWVEIMGNRVWRADGDGTNKTALASGQGISTPDGIVVDPVESYVYWTNMGSPIGGANLGSLQRLKLGESNVETVVPIGVTNTPAQLGLDTEHSLLYWCDRDGAKIWRAHLDGSSPEVLISGHNLFQPYGIALDPSDRKFYFSDRIGRRIYRAGFDFRAGENDADRSDVEELFAFSASAMPLDIDLDLEARQIYWVDRARGTLQRASMDPPAGRLTLDRTDIEVLAMNLPDLVGLALDRVEKQLYFTELSGDVWRANLDGSERKLVVSTGSAAGVKIVRMP
jgi:sugar lactone lactonase YvrE